MQTRLAFILKLAVSVGLVAFALSRADLAAALALLPDLAILPLIAMLAANLASRLLSAYRWYRLVKPVQPDIGFPPFVRITLGSSFYGQFLPGGGVEALQVAGLSRSRSTLTLAVSSVLADRAFGVLALALLMLCGVAFARSVLPVATVISAYGFAAAAGLLVLALVIPGFRRVLAGFMPPIAKQWIQRRFASAGDYLDMFSRRPALIVETMGLAVAMQLLRVLMFWLGALALGAHVPAAVFLFSVPAILLLLALPVTIGGIGIREGSLVFFFSLFGFSTELALALALLVYLGNILVAIPGAWFGLHALRSGKAVAPPPAVGKDKTAVSGRS